MNLTKDAPIIGTGTVKIKSRFHKLGFTIVLLAATLSDAMAAFYAGTIEGSKEDLKGTTKVLLKQSLGDALEIAGYNQGSVVVTTGATANNLTSFTFEGTLEITPRGSILPLENVTYYFTVAGFPNNSQINVDAYPTLSLASTSFKYDQVAIDAGVETPVDIAQAKWLAIPKDKLDGLQLFYPDGFKHELTPREIKRICAERNEASFVIDGKTTVGSNRLFVLDVATAYQALITNNAVGNVYVVKELALPKN